ncbi:hypothetical protein OUZ56_019102 [Daphnia magna]|uniref:Uncharacterized protein n=1 Tax=Daphnia magna TaxID=35525 RepID=A0ABQ9ZAM9_9CRUS|nr:hypothetical protein OUZ56_019102 [Daphnia magna]
MRKKMGDISFFCFVCSDLPRANRHLLADHLQRSFLDALHNRRRRNQRENYDVKLGTFLKKKRKMAKIGREKLFISSGNSNTCVISVTTLGGKMSLLLKTFQ